jgi:spore coat polysaccharide biosynthesis protein SpsF
VADAAVVLQARTGSARLPGKVLAPFGTSTLLGHIAERLLRTGLPVWVATGDGAADDAVEAEALRTGARAFRGDEADVLGRFAACVEAMPERPGLVVRMCADRPFACPVLVAELLELHAACDAPDYLSNTLVKSWPDGLDAEVMRTEALLAAAAEAGDPDEREHVTPFLYRRPERFSLVSVTCPYGGLAVTRATIDTAEDLRALRAVDERLRARAGDGYDHRDVVNAAVLDPEAFPR